MKNFKLPDGSVISFDSASNTISETKNDTTYVYQLDAALVQAYKDGTFDSADGAVFFARQLEHIKANALEVKYAELKARQLFAVSNEAPEGATSITTTVYDSVTSAKVIGNNVQDLPRADIAGKEYTVPVRVIGTSFGYTTRDMRASSMAGGVGGMSLDARKAQAANKSFEQTVNQVAFFGDAVHGLHGLFSHPDIPTGPALGGAWVGLTPDQIVLAITDAVADVWDNTLMVEVPNTILLPPAQYARIGSVNMGTNRDQSILEDVLGKLRSLYDPNFKIIPVNECTAANNPLLADDAMVVYNDSAEKAALEIPMELQFHPVQRKGLEFLIPAEGSIAGLNVNYPLAFSILTGI